MSFKILVFFNVKIIYCLSCYFIIKFINWIFKNQIKNFNSSFSLNSYFQNFEL